MHRYVNEHLNYDTRDAKWYKEVLFFFRLEKVS